MTVELSTNKYSLVSSNIHIHTIMHKSRHNHETYSDPLEWHPHSLNLTLAVSLSTLQDNCKVSWRGIQLSNSGGGSVTTASPCIIKI